MSRVLEILADIRVIIGIAVLVVLLIIWFIVQKVRSSSYRRILEELEVRYNNIKSVPLSFKLNKAVAISRVDPDAMNRVANSKEEFDKADANLKQIQQALADTEDEILVGKLRRAKADLDDLEASIKLGEKQVADLNAFLDEILEKETQTREQVNELKNTFRSLKSQLNENSSQLSYIWPVLEDLVSDTEKRFSAFEEWMYASDFGKASEELRGIEKNTDRIAAMNRDYPALLEDARGVIPQLIEVVHDDYQKASEKGVFLKHLEVEKNLGTITNGLKTDLENLKKGQETDVRTNLDDYKARLTQLKDAVDSETDAFEQLNSLTEDTQNMLKAAQNSLSFIKTQYAKMRVRFGLEGFDESISAIEDQLNAVTAELNEKTAEDDEFVPASEKVLRLQQKAQKLTEADAAINAMRTKIENASGDEDRAKKQLVKLQVIMNQMEVSIRKYKLPTISAQYEEDMAKAKEYIRRLEGLIDENPLNVNLLNSTLTDAIDFIYKLYNNVNNVVGAVVMVENTIVFGNRYRSTYSDIDSELTKSELSFRNGDYTTALTIAIATIEKIFPGNYEKLVKDNAKGGE